MEDELEQSNEKLERLTSQLSESTQMVDHWSRVAEERLQMLENTKQELVFHSWKYFTMMLDFVLKTCSEIPVFQFQRPFISLLKRLLAFVMQYSRVKLIGQLTRFSFSSLFLSVVYFFFDLSPMNYLPTSSKRFQ